MNHRLTVTAAVAVILASVSIYPLIQGVAWFWIGVGAVIVVAAAGTITRLPALHATVAATLLALIVCAPLLTSPTWFGKVVGVVLVAVTAASRPRIRGTRAFAWLVTYVAALLIYLNGVFAGGRSVAGLVPTANSLHHLWALAVQGLGERAYAPPVPGTHGIDLVAAAGIGLMAAATDFLAVRMRSPAIAGLPLLALYSVRITTNAKQGGTGATLVFCLGLIGYLALLAADGRERLRIWGRLVTVWHGAGGQGAGDRPVDTGEAPDTRALSASGRRIGLAAACIALAFPLLVPGIRVHDLFASTPSGPGTGAGHGGGLISLPNPLAQMHAQLLNGTPQTVLTFRTTARVPQDQYLQIYVLNYNPGQGSWTLVAPQRSTRVKDGVLLDPPGLALSTPTADAATKIKLRKGVAGYGSGAAFLPLPYAPTSLHTTGNWVEDDNTLMVYSPQPRRLSGLSYTVDSSQPEIGKQQIDRAPSYPAYIKGNYLQTGGSHELATLAQTITKDAHTPYQKAHALQNWFLTPGRFKYDLQSNVANSTGGLVAFLTKTRSGFCQQFASAMAVLARELRIPSRVAVGYTAGTRQANGTWKVTTNDAHVWPELYFTGVGWIRFEPTPGGLGGQGTATEPQYAAPPGIPKPTPTPSLGAGAAGARNKAGNLAHNLHPLAGGGGAVTTSGADIAGWILLGVAILLGLAVITPLTARVVIRRRRVATTGDAALAHAAWLELRDNLADFGFACRPSESPRAVTSRVAATLRLDPAAREALGRIASAEERARYATVPLSSQTLRADTAAVRRALSQEAPRRARWRARLLPPSTLRLVRPGVQHALDVFGWMDLAGLRIRRVWPGHSAPTGRA
jgi:transglutaminase-like putative cysteine protease